MNPAGVATVSLSVLKHLIPIIESTYGVKWPHSYFAFDTETSGASRDQDVVLEWGHCLVEHGKVVDNLGVLINWFDSDMSPDWLRQRLHYIGTEMSSSGRSWRITEDLLRREGIPPREALPWIFSVVDSAVKRPLMLVSHNGWNFDVEMLASMFHRYSIGDFNVPENQMFDTGALVKAMQMERHQVMPKPGESLKHFFKRITYMRLPGVKWSLDGFCVQHFGLERYGVSRDKLHGAGADAEALHYLMQELWHRVDSLPVQALPRPAAPTPVTPRHQTQRQRNR